MFGVFRVETGTGDVCLIYLQVKMPQNGRKNVFRDKQIKNKVPLLFLHAKLLTER